MEFDREHDRPHPLQIQLYQRATPTQKLAMVAQLNATAIRLKEADLPARFPEMTASERHRLVRHGWLTAGD
jgi:hypothetical protein